MVLSSFWALIETTRKESENDDEFISKLKDKLVATTENEIIGFERILRTLILRADHYNVLAAEKIIEGYVSDDLFLYFRCWLISQGKDVFENTIINPDSLSVIVEKDQNASLEGLLYVTNDAYSELTGIEEEETFPRDVCIFEGLDYDMPKNPTQGEAWEENQLPKLYPNLWNTLN